VTLQILALGWSTTVQDAGRPGHAAIGVPPSGALDPQLRALVNRLVGNAEEAAVLETAGGLRLRASVGCTIATSAELGVEAMRAGAELAVDPGPEQLWAYLAVRGGLALEPVLGSVSHDTLSGLGPPPLRAGQILMAGPDPATELVVDVAPVAASAGRIVVWPGPRAELFGVDGLRRFAGTPWRVSSEVSRIGMRLDGPKLHPTGAAELPSEGLITGSIQVPPDGRPIVMLADHPTTGGYPVIAVVDPNCVAAVAQTRPGSTLHLDLRV